MNYDQVFKSKIDKTNKILIDLGYKFIDDYYLDRKQLGIDSIYLLNFKNENAQMDLTLSAVKFESNYFDFSINLYNKNKKTKKYWGSFSLFDYLSDNHLKDSFKTRIKPDEDLEAGIEQFFECLNLALQTYLKPIVSGEVIIDHRQRMMDQFYSNPAVKEMHAEVFAKHRQKQGDTVGYYAYVKYIIADLTDFFKETYTKIKQYFGVK